MNRVSNADTVKSLQKYLNIRGLFKCVIGRKLTDVIGSVHV